MGTWLDGLGLGEYAERFKQEDIDGCTLLELTESDLRESLGVVLGDRKDMMREISMLKLIFKKQLYPNFKEVKEIDFGCFTVDDLEQLDEKSQLKV